MISSSIDGKTWENATNLSDNFNPLGAADSDINSVTVDENGNIVILTLDVSYQIIILSKNKNSPSTFFTKI